MNVLISGGSGMLGREISDQLLKLNHNVGWLSRKLEIYHPNIKLFFWKPSTLWIDQNAINWADVIINLAGESIGEIKWTESGKQLILDSRVNAVKTISEGLKLRREPIQAFIGVSGVGIYGSSEVSKKDSDSLGADFPASVANNWEKAYGELPESKISHKSIIRLAVVLSATGGALPKIVEPIRLGVGAPVGTGLQYLNWIHLEDAAAVFIHAIGLDGVYNASAPEIVTNEFATLAIAKEIKRRILFPAIPAFVLKIFLGERSQLVTSGNITDNQKLMQTGFVFKYPDFKSAISNLLRKD